MTIAFWSTITLLLAGALLFVLPPLLRPGGMQAGPSPLTVYREQRAQFDAEMRRGSLTQEQHAQALAELQGRVATEVGELPQPPVTRANRLPPLASILAVGMLLPVGALVLYSLLGKPEALVPVLAQTASGGAPHTLSREQMEEMVESLATKLKKSPDDAAGWHMLARSYVAIGRLPEAAQAYDRASTLAPRDAQVLADYADTLAMVNGRNLEGRPTQLIDAALKVDPAHPKALALAGTAAFNRGDFASAVASWRKLQAVLPPGSEQARSIANSIDQAQVAAQKVPSPVATAAAPKSGMSAAPPASPAAAGDGSIEGRIVIADALKPRLAPGTTLFIFAKAAGAGPSMPLAILRVPAGQFPYRFKLDDSLSMVPVFKLSSQQEVMLGARISRSDIATTQSGDLTGTLGPVKVGARDVKLVIEGVVP